MKTIAIAVVALFALTSAASAISLNPEEDIKAKLRAYAAENARYTGPDGVEEFYTIDLAMPSFDRANTPNCVNTLPGTLFANNANPINIGVAGQCGYQVHTGPVAGLTVVAGGGFGGADAWNYGFPWGYRFVTCFPGGVSSAGASTATCGSFHFGAPLSAFTVWDGFVFNGIGSSTAAVYS